jgi:hypothetical protein
MLALVPCNHFWLAVCYKTSTVIAICKHFGCRKRGEFTQAEWEALGPDHSLNKPIRL